MRVFILATMLLASSSLGSLAQEPGKPQAAAPQAGTAAQTDQNSPPPPDQKAGREQQKTDEREMGQDWRIRRSDGDRMGRDDRGTGRGDMMDRGESDRIGRDDRETGHRGMMRRDSDRMEYDRDQPRGRYQQRGDIDWDHAERERSYRGYADTDLPSRRVKICVEYDNGEEYCRYRH